MKFCTYDYICTLQRPPATKPEPLRSDSPAAAAYNSADGATEADAPEYEPAGKTMFIQIFLKFMT